MRLDLGEVQPRNMSLRSFVNRVKNILRQLSPAANIHM